MTWFKLTPSLGLTSTLLILLATSPLLAQKGQDPKWIAMDYGPYSTHSFQASEPPGNIAYKGIRIQLGDDGASILFDCDLLRYAGGWFESDLDWRNVSFDGSHGTHPHIMGEPVFVTPSLPGWAHERRFDDPRQLPYGPLSHDHARYHGLYMHGSRVILSYSVGKTDLLEMPWLAHNDSISAIARTIEIQAHDKPLLLTLSQRPAGLIASTSTLKRATLITFRAPPAKSSRDNTGAGEQQFAQQLRGRWSFDADQDKQVNNSVGKLHDGLSTTTTHSVGVHGQAMKFSGKDRITIADHQLLKMGLDNYSITAWLRTTRGGTIFAKGPAEGTWEPKGKTFFVRSGKLCFDIGWVGVVSSRRSVASGRWHHVAVTCSADGTTRLFVDGQPDNTKTLTSPDDPQHVVKIGHTADNFVPPLVGALDEVTFHQRILSEDEIAGLAGVQVVRRSAGVAWTGSASATLIDDQKQLRLELAPSEKTTQLTAFFWHGEQEKVSQLGELAQEVTIAPSLKPYTTGGPARYAQTVITTEGALGADNGPYAIDKLSLPRDNPWNSWMRIGGFDFFNDNTKAAVCTWSGDVWTVEGVYGDLKQLRWRRIATGMFQPLGLKIIDDVIYVSCRDQITRLHDLNGDGEMDFYETFNNDHQVTQHFHEFVMDLQTDKQGNFYYAKSARHALDSVVPHHGTLIKVSSDGTTSEIVCNGFRAANGVGIGPDGELATSDQEGHWTPANRINLCKPGGFYGNMYSFHRGERPTTYDPPLVWLPKSVDRSPAAQLWVTSDSWGPFEGHMLSTSYGTGKLWHVMYEQVDGVFQGAVASFPFRFPTGIMRGRFHPQDGQLYLCGLVGWSSNTGVDGGFFRVRRTDKPVLMPIAVRVVEDGIYLGFTDKLEAGSAVDTENYAVEQWNYRWTANYGSPHFKVSNPRAQGQDEVEILDISLQPDGKTIFLEIEDLKPVMQMQITYNIKGASGLPIKGDVWMTINKVGSNEK
jgi:hypothetical protein